MIRLYTDSDHDGVVALWNDVFPNDPPWNAPDEIIRNRQGFHLWVAEADGRIVGTIIAGFDGMRGWIYHLGVHESMRRKGIAKDLMLTAERKLSELGCIKVNLQVRIDNPAVIPFYERLGFAVEHRVQMGKPMGKFSRS
jgi:ribosomal protein S18 acetylase RimI-like enzyme